MVNVYARATCGCCQIEMKFETEASARAAFTKAGLGHLTIVDDTGEEHGGVDTFYGYSVDEEEQGSRGLGYLVEQLTGTK